MPQGTVELGWPWQKLGAEPDNLSWKVEFADKVSKVIFIAGGLRFELPKVEFNCVLEMPHFLVYGSKNQAVRFEKFVECLVTNFTSSNCYSVSVMPLVSLFII